MKNTRNHWLELIYKGKSIYECNDLYIMIEQIAISFDGKDCILIIDGDTKDDDFLQRLVSMFHRGEISDELDSMSLDVTNFYFNDKTDDRVVYDYEASIV